MAQVTKLIENNYEIGPSRLFLEYDANGDLSENGKKELENVLMANFYFNFGSFVLEDDEKVDNADFEDDLGVVITEEKKATTRKRTVKKKE